MTMLLSYMLSTSKRSRIPSIIHILKNSPGKYAVIDVLIVDNNLFFSRRDDIEWLRQLPYSITLPKRFNAVIVHAGLLNDRPLENQLLADMYLLRNVLVAEDGSLQGTPDSKIGDPWIDSWKKDLHVFFGHDAKRLLQLRENATGLDTGCCYG